ncbi:hypothetical protein EYF80_038883 [Liparis tanakae]|uniref:Uncharacterized protein n=1 Tax=Liparis tanakae TaxID=230148 RepID=A0A4Z2GE03_9TELE|nr:hypothetical protein EYF80_038883 [Liparis tanakae]
MIVCQILLVLASTLENCFGLISNDSCLDVFAVKPTARSEPASRSDEPDRKLVVMSDLGPHSILDPKLLGLQTGGCEHMMSLLMEKKQLEELSRCRGIGGASMSR